MSVGANPCGDVVRRHRRRRGGGPPTGSAGRRRTRRRRGHRPGPNRRRSARALSTATRAVILKSITSSGLPHDARKRPHLLVPAGLRPVLDALGRRLEPGGDLAEVGQVGVGEALGRGGQLLVGDRRQVAQDALHDAVGRLVLFDGHLDGADDGRVVAAGDVGRADLAQVAERRRDRCCRGSEQTLPSSAPVQSVCRSLPTYHALVEPGEPRTVRNATTPSWTSSPLSQKQFSSWASATLTSLASMAQRW